MLDKINAIEARYNEINQLIEQSVDDYAKTNELMKERSDIEEIVEKGREYKSALQQLEDAKELTGGQDQEMSELAQTAYRRAGKGDPIPADPQGPAGFQKCHR